MNIDLASIKGTLTRMFARNGKSLTSTRIVSPTRDWKLVLFGASLMVLVSGGWAAYAYVNLGTTAPLEEGKTSRKQTLDRDELAKTLEAFAVRAQKHQSLQQSAPGFVDPGR